jgi:ketosteroid isomerase-like protein
MLLPGAERNEMRSVFCPLAAGLFLSIGSAALADDRSDLLALERRWDEAIVRKDAAALETILADDFLLIGPGGAETGKRELIAGVADPDGVRFDPFETEGVRVRVYGDAAIMTGHFTQTAHLGERSETVSMAYTDVYHRTPAGWRAVSAQATLIRQPKPGG